MESLNSETPQSLRMRIYRDLVSNHLMAPMTHSPALHPVHALVMPYRLTVVSNVTRRWGNEDRL